MKHTATDGKGVRTVYLNGERVERVIEADDVEGYVIRHTGNFVGDEFETEVLQGEVRVEFANGNG